MINLRKYILLAALFNATLISAQTLTATIDRQQILIGEQITFQVKLDNLLQDQHSLLQWVVLPDTFNHFELVRTNKADTIRIGSGATIVQKFVLTSFDSGQWQIPPYDVLVKVDGFTKSFTTPSLTVDVLPADISGMQDYNGLKDIIPVETTVDYWRYGLIASLVLIIAVLIIYLFKRRKQPPQNRVKQPSGYDWAQQQLSLLKKQQSTLDNQVVLMRLDEIYRGFLQRQTLVNALHKTSDEIMVKLQNSFNNDALKLSFFQFMRMADAVKFARYQPSQQEVNTAINITEQFLGEINNSR